MSIIQKIRWYGLPTDQYIREETEKYQIYIHHTAGGPDPLSVVDWWNSTPARVGTHFIIGGKPFKPNSNWKDGDIIQCYNSKYWAYHLGLSSDDLSSSFNSKSNLWLNSHSIGIELCNWGPLKFDPVDKRYEVLEWDYPIDDDQVIEYPYPYRGSRWYQKYTEAQLSSLRELLIYLGHKFNISLEYKGDSIFVFDKRALDGESGVWTHTTVRKDKSDCHPQPELIDTLKSL